MIVVVGIGADGMAGLAPSARAELARATVIYGSARQLDLLDDSVSARRRPWPSPMLPALRTLLDDAEGDVHVVASGDPLMHGVGGTLIRLYGPDKVAVLPHVSSVTLACSRVGWTVQDTEIISLVTAEPHTAVRRGGQAVVMSRDATTPADTRAAAHRNRARRFGDHRARTTRRSRGAAAVGDGAGVGGAAAGRRRRTSTSSPCATCPTNAGSRAARRLVRPRRADHQTVDARGHVGRTRAAARRAPLGRRCRFGQHRDRMVPQRCGLSGCRVRTRRTTTQADRRQRGGVRRRASTCDSTRQRLSTSRRPLRRSSSAAA